MSEGNASGPWGSRAAISLFLVTAIFFSAIRSPAGAAQADPQHSARLKAVFLYNLAIFTDWPADAFPEPATPLSICVLGDEWVFRELNYRIAEKSVNGRGIRIRRTILGPELHSCHVLLVGSLGKKQLPEVLRILQGSSVLTVSEMDRFVEGGGAIQLSVEEDRVRFAVKLTAVERARLKISSKLLNLSRITMDVRRSGGN